MPFEGELTTLAEAAAVALVAAMGTNAWTSVRDATARVFRRGRAKGHDKISDRLDDDASLVAAADDQAGERAALEPFWRLKFRELVNAAPECAPDLAEIVRAHEAARPVPPRLPGVRSAAWRRPVRPSPRHGSARRSRARRCR